MVHGGGAVKTIIAGCTVATMDGAGSEWADGHVLCDEDVIVSVGPGRPAEVPTGTRVIDGRGCLATPGLVNCHHHLYQWATRGLAQQANLFEWLVALYPTWARIDAEVEYAAGRAALAALALSGCSTTTDHHYIFPREGGDLLAAEIEAARSIGLRFHPCRGSMDLGRSHGGLPPDEAVEDREAILAATEAAIRRYHDPSPGSMLRIAIAPCSPFSATGELMRESAELARREGVRLHTHLAETVEEEAFCLEQFGARPVEYLESLGWTGPDVWLAHCVHLSDPEVERLGRAGTGVAHCPSSNARLGAGIARVTDLIAAGCPVGLGVDGAASNEAGELRIEVREALLYARLRGGARAMTAREALELATRHGARCLGREREIGSLEPGKRADVALWRLAGGPHDGVADPVAALVFGPPAHVDTLLVDGGLVVAGGRLATASEEDVAADARTASQTMAARAVP
jgi:cytosine/adenosine deaminase-related metal-dependent hydrolase